MDRRQRKTKIGNVVSAKCDKTRIVLVTRRVKEPFYKKFITKRTRIMIHDADNKSKVGDTVKIMECRPLSKMKRWFLVDVFNNKL